MKNNNVISSEYKKIYHDILKILIEFTKDKGVLWKKISDTVNTTDINHKKLNEYLHNMLVDGFILVNSKSYYTTLNNGIRYFCLTFKNINNQTLVNKILFIKNNNEESERLFCFPDINREQVMKLFYLIQLLHSDFDDETIINDSVDIKELKSIYNSLNSH